MTVKLRRNWTLVTLMNVACACVSACVPVCVCMCVYVEACANRRRNAIKWKLLKKAKMRNENSRHTLHCSPSAHHTHSLVFFLTPSLDNVTRQRVHCWRFCTNYAEIHVQARCVYVTLFFFWFFSDFPPHFVFFVAIWIWPLVAGECCSSLRSNVVVIISA